MLVIQIVPSIDSSAADGAPTIPLGVTAVAGNGRIVLNWTAPVYSNDSAVKRYDVYRGNDQGNFSLLVTLGNVLVYEDVGLVNGMTYFYGVKAINNAGESDMSNATWATPRSIPNRPLFPAAEPGNLFLNVTWTEPDFDGGAPILGYNVYRSVSSGWLQVGNVTNQTWFVDARLTIGTTYTYRITAYNVAGEGIASDPVSGTPDIVPGSVTGLQAFSGVRNITLTWNTPETNGGSALIGYKVYRAGNSSEYQLISTISQGNRHVDIGLDDNLTYYYRLAAYNKVGDGQLSYEVFTSTYGSPEVTINSVIPGNMTVTLYWYPLEDGGAPVKRYWIYRGLSNDSLALYATLDNRLSWVDEDVVNGVTYYYRVAAENDVGPGGSQIVSCIPMTVPGRPLELDGTSWDHFITLTWNAPEYDGGAQILAYNIYRGATATGLSYIGTTNLTTYIVAGLEIDVKNYYQVTALNGAGEGARSGTLAIASGRTPTFPVNLTSAEGNSFVTLAWEKPEDSGTTVVDQYSIYRANSSDGFVLIDQTNKLTYNDTNVVNLHSYLYFVKAHNTIGYSDRSNVVSGYPHLNGTVPGVPLKVNATGGDGYIHVTWEAPTSNGGQPITGYAVYRGSDPTLMTYYKLVTTTEVNNTNLPLGTTFYYQVAAVNAIGQGNSSQIVNATTQPPYDPPKPEPFLWGIFESMFFYIALVLAACGIGIWFYMKKFRKKGFKKKATQKRDAGKNGLQQNNGAPPRKK